MDFFFLSKINIKYTKRLHQTYIVCKNTYINVLYLSKIINWSRNN